MPAPPKPPPPPPTLDQAAMAADAQDQIRKRRGVAANLLTNPNTPFAPNVGTKTLLGT